jgi:elongator complex protein 6
VESVLSGPDLADVSLEIQRSIQSLKEAVGEEKIVLIIDRLDLMLAAGGDKIRAVNIGEMLIGLQEVRDTLKAKLKG